MRLSRALVASALIVFAFSAHATAQTAGAGPSVAGEILVKFRPGVAASAKADAHRQAGGTLRSEIARTGVQLVGVPAGDQSAAIARYQRNPRSGARSAGGHGVVMPGRRCVNFSPGVTRCWEDSGEGLRVAR